jgi:hypothetical protein
VQHGPANAVVLALVCLDCGLMRCSHGAGKFALAQNQWLLPLLSPLGSIRRLYATVPFLSLIVFFAIYIGIINQRETWSRYVRFNAMQVSTMCSEMLAILME